MDDLAKARSRFEAAEEEIAKLRGALEGIVHIFEHQSRAAFTLTEAIARDALKRSLRDYPMKAEIDS